MFVHCLSLSLPFLLSLLSYLHNLLRSKCCHSLMIDDLLSNRTNLIVRKHEVEREREWNCWLSNKEWILFFFHVYSKVTYQMISSLSQQQQQINNICFHKRKLFFLVVSFFSLLYGCLCMCEALDWKHFKMVVIPEK